MAGLNKNDLKQMNRSYFQSLSQERLVEVADNLHILATELWEKQQQNSENSSQPPSLDNPYSPKKTQEPEHSVMIHSPISIHWIFDELPNFI